VASKPLAPQEEQMELDEIAEDIFSNFSLALQIIEDFKSGQIVPEVPLTEEKKTERGKLLCSLLIDATLRRADFAKFYCNGDEAMQDFLDVIKLCEIYPEGN
jgi:gamma-glutamylcysteine synthetase